MKKIIRVVRPTNNFTLFSNVFSSLSVVYLAELHGHLAYVDWSGELAPSVYQDIDAISKFGPNIWDWYFEQPHCISSDDTISDTWIFVDGEHKEYFKYDYFTPEDMAHKRSIFPRLLRPLKAVHDLAYSLFKEYGIDPSKTVAVQFRGNDSLHDTIPSRKGRPTLSHYYGIINEVLGRNPGFRIWIQTDDAEISNDFIKKYPDSVKVKYFETIHHASNLYTDLVSPKPGYQRGLDPAAMMVMLSRCAVMIKSVSNLADIAAALGNGEIIHIP